MYISNLLQRDVSFVVTTPLPSPQMPFGLKIGNCGRFFFQDFSFFISCTNDLRIDVSNQMARRKLHVGTNALFLFLIPFFLQEDFSSLTLD